MSLTKSFTLEHAGAYYHVELEIEGQWEDDSFDHEFGTEECGHWEIDWDQTEIAVHEITESTEEEVDVDDMPGLLDAIVDKTDGMDLSDLD